MNDILPLLTSAEGTASRREFWLATLVLIGAGLVLGLLPVIGAVVPLAMLYPFTCLSMRRLRDLGRSPRLALVPVACCAVAGMLALVTAFGASNPAMLATTLMMAGVTVLTSAIAGLVGIAFLLWIGLATGASDAPTVHGRR